MLQSMKKAIGRIGPEASDTLLAVGLVLFGWFQIGTLPVLFRDGGGGPRGGFRPPFEHRVAPPTWTSYALLAAAFLPLALRRRYPLVVLGVTTVTAAVYDATPGHPPAMMALAPLIALYTVGTVRGRRTLWLAAVGATVFTLALTLPDVTSVRWYAELVRIAAMFAFAAALGDATRTRRAYIAEVEQRALDAERTREEEARRRVEEERLRIARELHDVTAHSLSIIAVQAGAAEKVVERDPEAVKHVLSTIRTTSKAALDELRAMLGVLRGGDDATPFAPAGSLGRLDELIRGVEEAGVHVVLEVDAQALADLPAFADVSAYRIVQEALTNVVRHAGATQATVWVNREGADLLVVITDDGHGVQGATREGHGIAGMRERVVALGGVFEAGPADSAGFRVSARLPLKGVNA